MTYLASWSGGKDGCLALYKAAQGGYEVSHLLNFVSSIDDRVRFHGTRAKLVQLQAEALGVKLVQKETTGEAYEEEFKGAVRELIPDGIEGMVFGDIYFQPHLDWVNKVCGELGIKALEPLWGTETDEVLREFVDAGFEAIVVSAKEELFGEEWLGRRVDEEFVGYLKENGIDACGESGEYHTFVVDGPIFDRRIGITKSRPYLRDGRRFLDILGYSVK